MKFWSRSTLGVIIGTLSILLYIGIVFVMVAFMEEIQTYFNAIEEESVTSKSESKASEIGTLMLSTILAVCLVMAAISALLIYGIVKRLHKCMLPWLALSGIGFASDCARVIINLILSLINGNSMGLIMHTFIIRLLGVGIQGLILWPIYRLWVDIRRKNEEKPGYIIRNVQYEAAAPPMYDFYSAIPQKS